jgi:hypothetical protein
MVVICGLKSLSVLIMGNRTLVQIGVVIFIMLFPLFSLSQQTPVFQSKAEKLNPRPKPKNWRKHELYFSWGYNEEWYTHSNVSVSQPALGNSFTFVNTIGVDHPGWNEHFFQEALSIPQYNYRLGYVINRDKGWGVEINFDHTKWLFENNQMVHVKGKVNDSPFDGQVFFHDSIPGSDSTSYHYLNNGANFLLFNITKRWCLFENRKGTIRFDGIGKFGVGPVIPHVQVKYFEQPPNDQHFQLGGWNVGLEADLKVTFFQYVFVEYGNKLDYARYTNLKIYDGTDKQAFGTYEMILSLGVVIPVGKVVP